MSTAESGATLLVLGDSFSCGEGVGVRTRLDHTWAGLAAGRLGVRFESLATPGARIRDVRAAQLPQVRPAAVVTLLIGLNDVIRGGFEAEQFEADLDAVISALSAFHPEQIVLGRLHDPTAMFPMPGRLRVRFTDRVAAINAAVDSHREQPRVAVLDLARIDGLRRREAWAVDRIHPGASGHRHLADAVVALFEHGPTASTHPRIDIPAPADWNEAPADWNEAPAGLSVAPAELRWLVRHGLPWLFGNLGQVVVPVMDMFVCGRQQRAGAPVQPLCGRGVPG